MRKWDNEKHTALSTYAVPTFGRDEMNLCDFPYGPLTPGNSKTFSVNHTVFDKSRKRMVEKRMTITGSDAFGLPKPIDDQILIGLKALTQAAGFTSPKLWFSRYELCRVIGKQPGGREYRRIEESLDRIAGTTLKFKDGWWDNGDKRWKSLTFHLLDSVELCSQDSYEAAVAKTGTNVQSLCNVVWNENIWKSFQDGYIRQLDLDLLRRVANGRRRFAAVRLLRVLDKHFYRKRVQTWDVQRLCVGSLGLSETYVSKMIPILERAANVLLESDYLASFTIEPKRSGEATATFIKSNPSKGKQKLRGSRDCSDDAPPTAHEIGDRWLSGYSERELVAAEDSALATGFGRSFERSRVSAEKRTSPNVRHGSLFRKNYLRGFLESAESSFAKKERKA